MKLRDREQIDIINELCTNQSLRECLDCVEIIIGFLSSGGGNAKVDLKEYIRKALKMEGRFNSKKVLE